MVYVWAINEQQNAMKSTIITKGNRAVVINEQGGTVWANLYVNVREGIENADITLLQWKGKTMAAATKWSDKKLA